MQDLSRRGQSDACRSAVRTSTHAGALDRPVPRAAQWHLSVYECVCMYVHVCVCVRVSGHSAGESVAWRQALSRGRVHTRVHCGAVFVPLRGSGRGRESRRAGVWKRVGRQIGITGKRLRVNVWNSQVEARSTRFQRSAPAFGLPVATHQTLTTRTSRTPLTPQRHRVAVPGNVRVW